MLISIPSQVGYGALFGLVFAESAGIPLPGETALLGAGLLAGAGQLSLPLVVAVAAAAAILGDNVGYAIGRRGGRALLRRRGGFLARRRAEALVRGEVFFARHGAKTVFIGRWVTGVRVVAAVLAGATAMPWRTFALYNALGAVCWAATVAGIAAAAGPLGAAIVYVAGLVAAGGGLLGWLVSGWRARYRRRRAPRPAAASADPR